MLTVGWLPDKELFVGGLAVNVLFVVVVGMIAGGLPVNVLFVVVVGMIAGGLAVNVLFVVGGLAGG